MRPLDLVYVENLEGPHRAMDALFDYIDDLCIAGNFDTVDKFVAESETEIENLSTQILVGVLSITHPARSKLTNRKSLISACRVKFLKTEGERRAKALLDGFDI